MELLARLRRYLAHEDPLAAAANTIALVLAADGPFYPVTIWTLVGWDGWPAIFSVLVTPVFLAVPWLTRRSALGGRALFCLVATANVVWTATLLGRGCGLELFLLPCITLSVMLFRSTERLVSLPLVALPFAIFYFRADLYGTPIATLTTAEQDALLSFDAFAVASLTAAFGFIFAGLDPKKPAA